MSERKVEDVLSELGRKIDDLVQETKKAGSKVSDDIEKQIANLKEKKETIEAQLKDQSSRSGEKWSAAKEHLNEAAEALHKAVNSLFR